MSTAELSLSRNCLFSSLYSTLNNWSLPTWFLMSIEKMPLKVRTISLKVKMYYSCPLSGLNLLSIMRKVWTATLQMFSTHFVSSSFLIFSVIANYKLLTYWLSSTMCIKNFMNLFENLLSAFSCPKSWLDPMQINGFFSTLFHLSVFLLYQPGCSV